jgi:hypothetical protein
VVGGRSHDCSSKAAVAAGPEHNNTGGQRLGEFADGVARLADDGHQFDVIEAEGLDGGIKDVLRSAVATRLDLIGEIESRLRGPEAVPGRRIRGDWRLDGHDDRPVGWRQQGQRRTQCFDRDVRAVGAEQGDRGHTSDSCSSVSVEPW